MAQTAVLSAPPLLRPQGPQGSLPSLRVALFLRARGSPKAGCSHCVVAPAPNSGLRRASVARVMAGTRFVATLKRNGAVVVMARCDEFRRIARLQSRVKDIQHSPHDYRVGDTAPRARSNSTAADRA